MPTILLIDDDKEILTINRQFLSKEGLRVITATNANIALNKLQEINPDCIVMDVMMPGINGFDACKKFKTLSDTPIILLSGCTTEDNKITGLSLGADDYMIKPINVNEMVLRVGALLRRAQMINERRQTIGNTVLECDTFTVHTDGSSMTLPQKEFMLLYKMASYPGRIFTRQQLMDDVWGPDSQSEARTVDVHINRLRDRFRDNPDFEIITVRGIGYKAVSRDG